MQAENSGPRQTVQNAASDQGLRYLLAGISVRNRIK